MVRPIAQTAPHKGEVFDTPMEELLRGRSIFVPEPLDLPTDRDWPLEDILYAAGSAFARPSTELQDYHVTASKREAEAPAEQPEVPEEVTKPEAIAPLVDPLTGKQIIKRDGNSQTPRPESGIAQALLPPRTDLEIGAELDPLDPTKEPKLAADASPEVPESQLWNVTRRYDSMDEAAMGFFEDAQTLTSAQNQEYKSEYGAAILKRTDPDTGKEYYYFRRIHDGAASEVKIRAPGRVVALVHTHPRGKKRRYDNLNENLSPNDRNSFADVARKFGFSTSDPLYAYLATPSGRIRRFQSQFGNDGSFQSWDSQKDLRDKGYFSFQ